ncbi:MAG: sigma-70 family RNA polymerase sigma factor [Dehalococcoidia bacterium]
MVFIRYKVGEEKIAREIAKPGVFEDIQIRRLVERAVTGDIETFGELYGIYLDRIYRYVFCHVNNRATAEDLTEEVFLKAWEGISKYRWKGQPFAAWLYRIAHNRVIDYYRTNRQHETLDEELKAEGGDPEQEAVGRLTRKELLQAISSLPKQQRQVIILKFIEGQDNREIAQIMRKNEGAVRVMQMRALGALRRVLSGEVENEE